MSTSSKSKSPAGGKISIGYVSAAHGVNGGIRIAPLTDYPERFERMEFLNLYMNGTFTRRLAVSRVKHGSAGDLIIESDVSSRDEAERLAGASVLIEPGDRVPLSEGFFWVDDLIGLSVKDKEGRVLGVVENLISTGGQELYEIKDDSGKLHYIPAVEDFVKEINTISGCITVELIEGLWD